MVLRRWGVETNDWFMNKGKLAKEIGVLTFRTSGLRQWESIRSDEGLILEASALKSLHSGQITLSTLMIIKNHPAKTRGISPDP